MVLQILKVNILRIDIGMTKLRPEIFLAIAKIFEFNIWEMQIDRRRSE